MSGKIFPISAENSLSKLYQFSALVLEVIVNHHTKNCGFTYVLSVFLQNDPTEHRLGIYRMMSGAQYNVTVCQILQSERLIKILQFSNYSLRIQWVGAQSHYKNFLNLSQYPKNLAMPSYSIWIPISEC